jgi:murein L,D-transpeptidase YcbB/YkuD
MHMKVRRGIVLLGFLVGLVMPGLAASPAVLAPLQAALRQDAVLSRTQEAAESVTRFYRGFSFQRVWTDSLGRRPVAGQALQLLHRAPQFGLVAADYAAPALQLLADSIQQQTAPPRLSAQCLALELRLSTEIIRFVTHLHGGRLQPYSVQPVGWNYTPAFDDVAAVQRGVRSAEDFEQVILAVQPQSRSYVRLLWAWQRLLHTDSVRASQLARTVGINLERLRWEPATDSLYLAANIASQTLQVVRGSAVVATHRIVVGKPETPTPELASRVFYFQTAPEWRVPASIATGEMLPRLRRDPDYLADNNLRLYDRSGQRVDARRINWRNVTPANFAYQIRQAPSEDNALGNVVFRFANEHDVYLHDTPARQLFARPERLLSHGCIRLQRPTELAAFLLRRDGGKKAADRVERMWDSIERNETEVFTLRYSLPILVRYLTCEADGAELRCLPDVYGRDAALTVALYGGQGELLSLRTPQ